MIDARWLTRWRTLLDWRAEALSLALILAESGIAYLYLGVLLPDDIHPPYAPFPFWLVLVLLLLGYFLPHYLDLQRVFGGRYEATLLVATTLSLLLTLKVAGFPGHALLSSSWLHESLQALIIRPNSAVRPVWALVAVVAYAWWRGRHRAEPTIDAAYQMLRWGSLALALAMLLVMLAAPDGSPLAQRMSGAVVLFFTATLAALGFGRLRLEGIRSSSPLGARWLATFALPIGGIVLAAVLAGALFSHRFLLTVLLILSPVIWAIGLLLRLLVVIVALLAFVVIAPLLWLLERSGFSPLNGGHLPEITRGLTDIRAYAAARLNVADPLRYLIAGVILFLIASALTRYVYRRRRRWRQTMGEERDSVFVFDEVFGGLVRSLKRVLRPSRRIDSLARLRGDPRWVHTVTIRETYRRLQHWGDKAGVARAEAITPDEYGPVLVDRVPQAAAEIALIVDLYNAARYSGRPASGEEAERVRQAWAAVRRVKV